MAPESGREQGSVRVVRSGTLRGFEPGRSDEGWVVEVCDAGAGVAFGTRPGAKEELAVAVWNAAASG